MLYEPSPQNDTLLELWFHRLRTSGDLDYLYTADQRHLSHFLRSFQRPKELVVLTNDTPEIIAALWFDPTPACGAWCGMWVSPEHRHSRRVLSFILFTYGEAFKSWPILYGLTMREELLEPHRRLGYTIGPAIPHAFEGRTGWLVTLLKADFERSPLHGWNKGRRRQSREHDPRELEQTAV